MSTYYLIQALSILSVILCPVIFMVYLSLDKGTYGRKLALCLAIFLFVSIIVSTPFIRDYVNSCQQQEMEALGCDSAGYYIEEIRGVQVLRRYGHPDFAIKYSSSSPTFAKK